MSGTSATLWEWSGRTYADLPSVSADETLVFSVIATDSAGVSATAEVSVLVRDIGSAPEVDAGANQTVDEGASVQLSGSASDVDDNVDTLQWQQLSGPAVALSDSTILAPTFNAPQLASGDDLLVFRLTATDTTGLSSSADVTINVTDLDPPAPDTVAPVVTYAYTGADPNNRKVETARLNSDEPSTLYFRLSGPVTLLSNYSTPSTDYPGWEECAWDYGYLKMELGKGKDTAMIEYFARDSAGNISATQSSVVKP